MCKHNWVYFSLLKTNFCRRQDHSDFEHYCIFQVRIPRPLSPENKTRGHNWLSIMKYGVAKQKSVEIKV